MQTFAKKCQKVQKSAKKAGFYIIGDTIRTRVCRTFFVGFGNRKIVGWSVQELGDWGVEGFGNVV